MSSILKALQKLERDKETRKTREPDISSAIIMSGVRRKEPSRWLIPVLAISVASVSILITFTLMGGFSGKKLTISQSVLQPIPPRQSPPDNRPTDRSRPVAEPLSTPIESQFSNSAPPAPVVSKPRAATIQALPALPLPALPTATAKTAPAMRQSGAVDPQPAQPAEKPASSPRLGISGIAWQQDSAARIAVVNGISVSEGSSVDGVIVEQIFPDKVRFSHQGKSFEISLYHEGRN